MNKEPLKFYIDKKQAKKVFDLLIERLSQKGLPYNKAHVPQADQFLPYNLEKGTTQHAIFLFMLCLWMRAGTESDTAASFLKGMYESEPLIFSPSIYRDAKLEENDQMVQMISTKLSKYGLGNRVDENAPAWVYNMRKLHRFWNGDPCNLMNDKPDFKTLTKRIIGKRKEDEANGFMYFREKMVAMVTYFLMDAQLVPMFYTPVPVDFHVLRLCTSNLVIRVQGKSVEDSLGINFATKSAMNLAREVTEWYCRTNHISPLALCDSLWLLSRTFCRNNPGNSGYVLDIQRKRNQRKEKEESWFDGFEEEILEAEETEEVKGRKRYQGLKWTEKELLKPSKVISIERTCGRCPVNKTCHFNISAGSYYVGGKMIPERLRFIPPPTQPDFFGDGLMEEQGLHRIDTTVRFTEISLHA